MVPLGEVASLMATARALNALSLRWWSFLPRRQSTWRVILLASAKLSRKCGIISQERSPTFSLCKPSSTTAYGLFERSTTALESASSKGANPDPNLFTPRTAPRASLKAWPRAIPQSSVVWWSSMCKSPMHSTISDQPECLARACIIWSRNPIPVWTLITCDCVACSATASASFSGKIECSIARGPPFKEIAIWILVSFVIRFTRAFCSVIFAFVYLACSFFSIFFEEITLLYIMYNSLCDNANR
ncbi:hypothetical protein MMC68F_00019 [Mycoplasma mycoides subsp. capri]|nr:hypothetical protein MMC68F_00019 [Mycoplasma mycoides subsp. capri]SRX70139.1 hypothetical protein MMC68R_00019 [Mycoplasma mycoides subsp. capri]